MSRWGKPIKNRKHRDPRYFLNEEIEEQDFATRAAAELEREKELTAASDEKIKAMRARTDKDLAMAKGGSSAAEIVLDQYDGDPDKMPKHIRKAYDTLTAADQKGDAAAEKLSDAEDASDTAMAKAAKNPELSQHEELMAKGKMFMAAIDHVNKVTHPMHEDHLKKSALALQNGDMQGAMDAMKQAQQVMQFILWFGNITGKATVAGWSDQGASWDDVIEKAKKLGFKG